MEIQHYARVLWQWKWLLAIATLLGAITSYVITTQTPPLYTSSATLSVGQFLQSDTVTGSEFGTTQQLAQAYALAARRQDILEITIRTLGLQTTPGRLATQVNAAAVPQSQLLRISVVDSDPRRSQTIANTIAQSVILESATGRQMGQDAVQREFLDQQISTTQARIRDNESKIRELEDRLARENSARAIQDFQNQIATLQTRVTALQANYTKLLELSRGSRINFLTVVESAALGVPTGSPLAVNVLAAALAGFLLAALAAVGLDYFDDRITSSDEAQNVLDVPALGSIARVGRVKQPGSNLFVLRQPHAWISETFRQLRSNLRWANEASNSLPKNLVVTSPSPGEGKTTVACNLAVTLAQAGHAVILCDTDMRRPMVHRYFGVPNDGGLSQLLVAPTAPLETAFMDSPVANLRILTAGPTPSNPGDLLNTAVFARRLREMEGQADVVILDTPAVLVVADAVSAASMVETTILVVSSGQTRAEHARRAK